MYIRAILTFMKLYTYDTTLPYRPVREKLQMLTITTWAVLDTCIQHAYALANSVYLVYANLYAGSINSKVEVHFKNCMC